MRRALRAVLAVAALALARGGATELAGLPELPGRALLGHSDHSYKPGEAVALYANKAGPFHNPRRGAARRDACTETSRCLSAACRRADGTSGVSAAPARAAHLCQAACVRLEPPEQHARSMLSLAICHLPR